MRIRQIVGGGSFVLAGVLLVSREYLLHLAFGELVHQTRPTLVNFVNYGLPTILVLLGCALMFWPRRERHSLSPSTPAGADLNRRSFDIARWQHHDNYFVWVAACLWVPMEPEGSIPATHPAYPSLQHIKGALTEGKIKSQDGTTDMKARVSAEELRKHALGRGEFPKFLFPDDIKK